MTKTDSKETRPRRLVEIYRVGDHVAIYFEDPVAETWVAGRVIGLAHPGVWVQTEDGQAWFVTNSRRIRRRPNAEAPPPVPTWEQ